MGHEKVARDGDTRRAGDVVDVYGGTLEAAEDLTRWGTESQSAVSVCYSVHLCIYSWRFITLSIHADALASR